MDKKVKISICVPTFNRAGLLSETLASIASQTSKPYEVLVLDDASTDDTPTVVSRYQKFGIKYIRNAKNLGVFGNSNRCLQLFSGTHLSFLHSDDLISPLWHETWQKVIPHVKADLYVSAFALIGANGKIRIVYRPFPGDRFIPPGQVPRQILSRYFPTVAPTGMTVYSRDFLNSAGNFDESLGTESDADFFLRTQHKVSLCYRKQILFAYRYHNEQTFRLAKTDDGFPGRLVRIDRYFRIVKNHQVNFIKNPKLQRKFFLTHVLMTLTGTNLYLITGRLREIITAHRIAKKYFPDFLCRITDWKMYFRIQLMILYRTIFGKITVLSDYSETQWISKIGLENKNRSDISLF